MPWTPSIASEILAVHAALVPGGVEGEVVLFGGDEHWIDQQEPSGAFRKTRVYDVRTNTIVAGQIQSPDSDVFCAHHAFTADGRLLIAGGTQKWPEGGHGHDHDLAFFGHRRCWLYNARGRRWVEVARLNANPDQPGVEHSGGRWYPGLVTHGNGEVSAFFGHLDQDDSRHRNNTPERYIPGGNFWVHGPKIMGTFGPPNSGGRRFLFFPRVYQLPNGQMFFATPMPANFAGGADGVYFSTAYDPASGNYVDPKIPEPPGEFRGWDRPAVLLPLLPNEEYRARILFVGAPGPGRRLDLGDAAAGWQPTADRTGGLNNRNRQYCNAVLLPTGEVCVVGGVHFAGDATNAEDPVLQAELYAPGIDWTGGTYAGADSWAAGAAAIHARSYHSTALLLPNGKVWVGGGNTHASSGNPDDDFTLPGGAIKKRGIKQIELFEPDYIAVPNRVRIVASPRVLEYGGMVTIDLDRAAAGVRTVAIIRCSSVTHSTDNDQRFVQLIIESRSGNSVLAIAPPNGNVAPPGYYMLWVVDNSGRPCQLAPFVRLAHTSCTVVTDLSTYSQEQVAALGGGGAATFPNAVYLRADGFIHTELTVTPTVTASWADSGVAIPTSNLTLIPAGRLQEVNPGDPDVPQRITFPFHVRFPNQNLYAAVVDRRQVRLVFQLGTLSASETLDLTKSPNPYAIDVDPAANNPPWLSTDVRVFTSRWGDTKFGDIGYDLTDPLGFLRRCLDKLNNPASNGTALFDNLSPTAKLDLATLGWPLPFPIYNFAIARVRYRATSTTAQRVKCFFRGFNVAATGLEYDPNTTYRRAPTGTDPPPLLGFRGAEVVSIPFFAGPRVETVLGQPGAASMTTQTLDPNYEMRDLVPDPAGGEVTAYFGCWLDINQPTPRYPIAAIADGPWVPGACVSIQELMRGRHFCIATEIVFPGDPTATGETPGTSDNLSQRNLAILHSDNPGGPDSHTVMHPFELQPSDGPFGNDFRIVYPLLANPGLTAIGRRLRLDELVFFWNDLPADSEVTIYFSDIDTAVIQSLAALRNSPLPCEVVDKHTLRFKAGGAAWIPIPGGRELNIPALLSVKLPDTVVYGQEFRVWVQQVAGRANRVVGTTEFRIAVSKAELILSEEMRDLSVLGHIATTIPPDNRWYPIFQRYIHHLQVKVDALGGDSSTVHPNPDGSGRPYTPPGENGECPRPTRDICDLLLCLLNQKGVQSVLRRYEIEPKEVIECVEKFCRGSKSNNCCD
jgi:hypothetical protein